MYVIQEQQHGGRREEICFLIYKMRWSDREPSWTPSCSKTLWGKANHKVIYPCSSHQSPLSLTIQKPAQHLTLNCIPFLHLRTKVWPWMIMSWILKIQFKASSLMAGTAFHVAIYYRPYPNNIQEWYPRNTLDSGMKWKWNHSVVANSFWPHGLYSPWSSLGQNTEVGCHFLFQGIFPTQGSNTLQVDSLPAELPGKPWLRDKWFRDEFFFFF